MTHISAVIRNLNYMANSLEDLDIQLSELTEDVNELMNTYIPHFKRTEDTYNLINSGEQTTFGDFE